MNTDTPSADVSDSDAHVGFAPLCPEPDLTDHATEHAHRSSDRLPRSEERPTLPTPQTLSPHPQKLFADQSCMVFIKPSRVMLDDGDSLIEGVDHPAFTVSTGLFSCGLFSYQHSLPSVAPMRNPSTKSRAESSRRRHQLQPPLCPKVPQLPIVPTSTSDILPLLGKRTNPFSAGAHTATCLLYTSDAADE